MYVYIYIYIVKNMCIYIYNIDIWYNLLFPSGAIKHGDCLRKSRTESACLFMGK